MNDIIRTNIDMGFSMAVFCLLCVCEKAEKEMKIANTEDLSLVW